MKIQLTGIFKVTVVLFFFIFLSCNKNNVDNGTPTVKFLPRNDTEGNGGKKIIEVKARLFPPANVPVTVTYATSDSTARANQDYVPVTDGTLVFNPGETDKVVSLELIADTITEFSEAFNLRIVKVENANGVGQSLPITILDDDFNNVRLADDGYISADTIPGMDLFFADEFNDSTWRQSSFSGYLGEGFWRDQLQKYTVSPQNIGISNGKLLLTARKEGNSYTSAGINTINSVRLKYGLFQVRAKMPKGMGLWPSIWLLGSTFDGANWPYCGEIDIATLRGQEPGKMIGSAYYIVYDPQIREGFYNLPKYTDSFSDEYHVFSILWQQNKIDWYVDNKRYMTITKADIGDSWPFNDSFYIVISLAVGGSYVGAPDFTTEFPQTMQVDYFRCFEPK